MGRAVGVAFIFKPLFAGATDGVEESPLPVDLGGEAAAAAPALVTDSA